MKLSWTDAAKAHLQGIHDYIAQDSPRYAIATIDRITSRAKQCGAHPVSGAIVLEFASDDIREMIEYPYRIIYRVQPDRVDILAVVHGARKLPNPLP